MPRKTTKRRKARNPTKTRRRKQTKHRKAKKPLKTRKPLKMRKPTAKNSPIAARTTVIPVNQLERKKCEVQFHAYKKGKVIGKGANSEVFEVCKARQCPFVLKVTPFAPFTVHEVKTQIFVYDKLRSTPAVYDYWKCKEDLYILMERVYGSLYYYIRHNELTDERVKSFQKQLRDLVAQIHKIGLVHGDIGVNNIFVRMDNNQPRLILGDWGNTYDSRDTGPEVIRQFDLEMVEEVNQQLEDLLSGDLLLEDILFVR